MLAVKYSPTDVGRLTHSVSFLFQFSAFSDLGSFSKNDTLTGGLPPQCSNYIVCQMYSAKDMLSYT